MNFSYNPNPVIVHSGLLKSGKNYHLVIWGEQKKHKKYVDIEPFKYPFLYSPFELKLGLFRMHEPTFYGTFVSTTTCHLQVPLANRLFVSYAGTVPVYHVPSSYDSHLFPIEGLDIPINELYEYTTTILKLESNHEWELADDFIFFQRLLQALLVEISHGDLLPNQNGEWDIPQFSFSEWEELAPSSLFAVHPTNNSFIHKEHDLFSLKECCLSFINSYLKHLFKSNKEMNDAIHAILEKQPKNIQNFFISDRVKEKSEFPFDHQHFLETIGAIDVSPFKLGIRVEEKQATDDWILTMFIQDRKDESLMIDVKDLLIGHHPWRENPITFFKETLQNAKNQISELKPFSLSNPSIQVSIDQAFQLLMEHDHDFFALGITILVPSWWHKRENNFSVVMNQKDNIDKIGPAQPMLNWQAIADFDYTISVGDVAVTEKEFQELVLFKKPIVKLKGKWVYWDIETARKIQEKIEAFKEKKSLTYIEALQLERNDDSIRWQARWNHKISTLLDDLGKHSWEKAAIPSKLMGTLRPYQYDGFSWLMNMRRIGFGACLADDMGLGKTIQTISYMLAIKEINDNQLTAPFLLICPTSLIGNWEQEIAKFAPSLQVYVHHGTQRAESEIDFKNIDVILTSYSLAVRDEAMWLLQKWECLILDEAQHVKNIETKQRKTIKKIEAVHRIALTGTPIENRLKELWSIIDLLNDHFLGSYHQFSANFIKEIEGPEQNRQKLDELRKMISPFLLRRTKKDKDIQLQLPNKNEIIHRVGLTIEQASLYQAVINELFDKVDQVTEMERRALILSSFTKLKQICNHPVHYLKDSSRIESRSEKWDKLIELAEIISQNNEKALIFTQYKEMGSIIQKGLENHFNQSIPFLHGSLQRQTRGELIEQFTTKDIPFFILSLKAGGVGLNLTQATHVIHYDRWWNPAVENQATDRAYRIGQTEDVTVHKLVTKGTLEENIHLMLEKKQELSDNILNTNETRLSELSKDDLAEFLNLRISTLS